MAGILSWQPSFDRRLEEERDWLSGIYRYSARRRKRGSEARKEKESLEKSNRARDLSYPTPATGHRSHHFFFLLKPLRVCIHVYLYVYACVYVCPTLRVFTYYVRLLAIESIASSSPHPLASLYSFLSFRVCSYVCLSSCVPRVSMRFARYS